MLFKSMSAFLLAAAFCASLQAQIQTDIPAAANQTTAFVNVSVIPMDRERVLRDQTVVVRAGRIAAIGPASRTPVPKNAVRVDGRGKYLMPGLFDMHTHLFSDDAFPDELGDEELFVMLANGVTTVRLMIVTPEHLVMRQKIALQ